MTEKEKMEKGELYDAAIPELIEQLLSTRDKIFELNHLRPSQLEERRYDYEFFGCSTNDFPNEFFSFF